MITPKKLPDLEYLNKVFSYDPDTGALTWNDRPKESFKTLGGWKAFCRNTKGKQAGTVKKDGIAVKLHGEEYAAHRIIFKMMTGRDPIGQIDHKDMRKTNNRFCNLREATHAQNQHNTRLRKDNKTGFKGVTYDKYTKKYTAEIQLNKKRVYIERFDTAEEAHRARCEMTAKFHGDFARNG